MHITLQVVLDYTAVSKTKKCYPNNATLVVWRGKRGLQMINLHELLGIKEETFSNYKVHFATGSNDKKAPYNAFLIDQFKEWQECQTNKNFGRDYILSLIYRIFLQ